jgi:hypothetical protein
MGVVIIVALLIALSTICRAIKDTIAHHYSTSIFSGEKFNPLFWNPNISWKNKWKNGDHKQGEKFKFSSTALVLTTDAWHLFSSLELGFIHLAIAILLSLVLSWNIIIFGIGVKLIYAIFFNLFYDKFLKKK